MPSPAAIVASPANLIGKGQVSYEHYATPKSYPFYNADEKVFDVEKIRVLKGADHRVYAKEVDYEYSFGHVDSIQRTMDEEFPLRAVVSVNETHNQRITKPETVVIKPNIPTGYRELTEAERKQWKGGGPQMGFFGNGLGQLKVNIPTVKLLDKKLPALVVAVLQRHGKLCVTDPVRRSLTHGTEGELYYHEAKGLWVRTRHRIYFSWGVKKESYAGKLGIKPGAKLLTVSGKAVTSEAQFKQMMAVVPKGTTVRLVIVKDGQKVIVDADPARLKVKMYEQ